MRRGKGDTTVAKAQNTSYTGMHLRKRMGLIKSQPQAVPTSSATTTPSTRGANGNAKGGKSSRVNPIAVAGGLISAASLGYLLYTYLSTSSTSSKPSGNDDDDDDVVGRRSTTHKPSSSIRPRPSLSLSLSPTFDRSSPASISGLRALLSTISPLFVVHLILPGSETEDLTSSISALSATLGEIREFDARRILEYTHDSGRFALSRALACDCHVEIAVGDGGEEMTVEQLGRIRRCCGLVVYACFAAEGETGGRRVLRELKRSAQEEGGAGGRRDAPNGMRAFDLAAEGEGRWDALGLRLCQLRDGWK